MIGVSVVELEALVFVLPLLGYPVLIIVGLIVETPVLRQEPATQRRRTAAIVLAIISLGAAAPLLVMTCTLGAFRVLLLGGLVWFRRFSPWCACGSHRGSRQLSDRGTSLECHLIVHQSR